MKRVGPVDASVRLPVAVDLSAGADGDDPLAPDRNRAVLDDPVLRVHGDHVTAR